MQKFKIILQDELFTNEVMADFKKDYYTDFHHIEFHGKATSETGYRSYFFSDEELKEYRNIEEYIKELVVELSGQEFKSIKEIKK